jgi:hypothetical protein
MIGITVLTEKTRAGRNEEAARKEKLVSTVRDERRIKGAAQDASIQCFTVRGFFASSSSKPILKEK